MKNSLFIILILAPKPDFSLIFSFWDLYSAKPLKDDADMNNYQFGFHDSYMDHFRWIDRTVDTDPNGRGNMQVESRHVPLPMHFLWGPPALWCQQSGGELNFGDKNVGDKNSIDSKIDFIDFL